MKTKRNLLVSIMAMVMALCAFCGIMTMTNTAKADGISGLSVAKFTSIKVDEPQIRFYAVMDADAKAQAEQSGYGFLIFPQSYYTNEKANLDTENFHALAKKVEIPGDIAKIYPHEEGTFAVTATLKDIQADSFAIRFTCVAYIGNAEVGYSYAYDQDLGVSIQDIASKNYLDVKEDENQKEVLMNTYGPDSIYGFGSTNPILVTDGAQMSYIADQVAADADYALNFKLDSDIKLADDCSSIADTYKGTFDGAGKTVTAALDASLIVGKTATDLNYVENVLPLSVENDKYLVVTEENTVNKTGYKNNAYSVAGGSLAYIANADFETEGLTGDYTGNAVKWSAVNNDGWEFINQLSYFTRSLANLENQYDTVVFNFAVKDTRTTSTSYYWNISDGMLSYSNIMTSATGGSLPVGKYASGEWFKIEVPIRNFTSYIQGKESVFFFDHSWSSIADNNNVSHMDFYFGDIEFTTSIPENLIDFDNLGNNICLDAAGGKKFGTDIYNNDKWSNKAVIAAEDVSALGFSGNYTGPAIKYTSSNNSNWYIVNRFSARQLNELANNYQYVRLNYAAVKNSSWVEGRNFSYYNKALIERDGTTLNFSFTADNVNQWMTIDVTIASFVKYILADGNITTDPSDATKDNILRLHHRSWGQGAWDGYDIYMGNIEFISDPVEQKIVTIESTSSITHVDYTEKYLDAAGVAALGFSGDYSGGAVYYTDIRQNSSMYNFANPNYTVHQKQEIIDKYSSVKFNVAMYINPDLITDETGYYYNIQLGLAQYCNESVVSGGSKVWQFNQGNRNTWLEYTVSIEDYLAYIETQSDYVEIGRYHYSKPYGSAWPTDTVFMLYFGDIEFVPKTAE